MVTEVTGAVSMDAVSHRANTQAVSNAYTTDKIQDRAVKNSYDQGVKIMPEQNAIEMEKSLGFSKFVRLSL